MFRHQFRDSGRGLFGDPFALLTRLRDAYGNGLFAFLTLPPLPLGPLFAVPSLWRCISLFTSLLALAAYPHLVFLPSAVSSKGNRSVYEFLADYSRDLHLLTRQPNGSPIRGQEDHPNGSSVGAVVQPCKPPKSQTRIIIGIGIPISHKSKPRPMLTSNDSSVG